MSPVDSSILLEVGRFIGSAQVIPLDSFDHLCTEVPVVFDFVQVVIQNQNCTVEPIRFLQGK